VDSIPPVFKDFNIENFLYVCNALHCLSFSHTCLNALYLRKTDISFLAYVYVAPACARTLSIKHYTDINDFVFLGQNINNVYKLEKTA